MCVCVFSTLATIANILQFSYFPSWPFLSGSSSLCAYSFPSLCIHSGFGKGFTSLLLVCFLRQGHANAWGRIMLECRCLQHRKYVATGYTSATSSPSLLCSPLLHPLLRLLPLVTSTVQWRLIAVGASWAPFLQPSLQFLFVPLSGDLLLPVALHIPPPAPSCFPLSFILAVV